MTQTGRAVRGATVLVGASLLLGLHGPSQAKAVPEVDLLDEHVVVLDSAADIVGSADVNGDGLDDLVVAGDRTNAQIWVVFGPLPAWIDVDHLGPNDGYLIYSTEWDGLSGASVALVGDVNGDGREDLAASVYTCERRCYERTYVVFGKADGRPIHLNVVGFDPLPIRLNAVGLNPHPRFGYRVEGGSFVVAGAGDVNGDGRDDILLGGYGDAYVLFGKPDYSPVAIKKLQRTTATGYYIWLWRIGSTYSVANAGDVNRDGLLDAVIGTIRTNNSRGRAYVIFGQRDTDEIDVTTDHLARYRIRGLYSRSFTGAVVDGGSDVNGDGLPDQLVTAPAVESAGPGDAFVVFGKTDARAVRLTNPRHHALQIPGIQSGDNLGIEGDLVGDVNRDGLGDVALLADANYPSEGPGRVHVVYGHRTRLVADLDDPSTGFRIVAPCDPKEPCAINYLDDPVGVADFDGDGLPDIAVVGRFATSDRYADEGKVFVIGSSAWID